MPRLESQAKAGYYPTPEIVVQQINELLEIDYVRGAEVPNRVTRILDPCCGTGKALMLVGEKLATRSRPKVETYGIELSAERIVEARSVLDIVLAADLFNTSIAHGAFSVLYLNPPYDDEGQSEDGSKRTEMAFLQRCTPYLRREDGILVYIIPKRILRGTVARFLSTHYTGVQCFDFPEQEREAFGQVVVLGKRRKQPLLDPSKEAAINGWSVRPPSYETVKRQFIRYECGTSLAGLILFNNLFLDPEEIAEEATVKGLWQNPLVRQSLWPEADVLRRPLMPLRQGHVAMLTAAGFLDNLMLEKDGTRILVKGRTFKEYETTEETEEKIVRIERMRASVMSLDLDTGEFANIKA